MDSGRHFLLEACNDILEYCIGFSEACDGVLKTRVGLFEAFDGLLEDFVDLSAVLQSSSELVTSLLGADGVVI